jgi:cation diffusion facilitator CzcD-associated flavoprotein CzcO
VSRDVDVLIVGAGHAGLAMSALLTEAGREHLVVDRHDRLGGGWQDRWDEFRLVTPNWTASFPGWAHDGPGSGRVHEPRMRARVPWLRTRALRKAAIRS